jgi:hypothetical protein
VDSACVIYAKCDLANAIKTLQEVSQKQGYHLWSLRGDPAHLQFTSKTVALRASIHTEKIDSSGEIGDSSYLGTVHIVSVSPDRTRLSFQRDDLAGSPLGPDACPDLPKFCEFFDLMLDVKGLKLSDDETGGRTQLFKPVVDTGPISL